MTYYTLAHQVLGQAEWGLHYTRSKDGKIMLFPSKEDAEIYRDAYYGPQGNMVHNIVELDVPEVGQDHQLMTAIKWWETREQR